MLARAGPSSAGREHATGPTGLELQRVSQASPAAPAISSAASVKVSTGLNWVLECVVLARILLGRSPGPGLFWARTVMWGGWPGVELCTLLLPARVVFAGFPLPASPGPFPLIAVGPELFWARTVLGGGWPGVKLCALLLPARVVFASFPLPASPGPFPLIAAGPALFWASTVLGGGWPGVELCTLLLPARVVFAGFPLPASPGPFPLI